MVSLIAHYEVYSGGNNANVLTTPSFTPANGEVFVIKGTTWDTNVSIGTPTGGAQAYTKPVEAKPVGFNGYAVIYVATCAGSPGAMTISTTPSASAQHQMIVERWGNAKLAVSPAVNAVVNGSGAPSANITTAADNSVVSWCSADVSSVDPAGRAYRLSATEDGIFDGHLGANSVQYFAYAAVGAAGVYAMGMTLPAGQTWVLAGVEIQDNTVTGTEPGGWGRIRI